MSEKTNTTGALDIGAVLSAARMKRDLSIATAAMQSNLSQEIIERLEQNRFAEIGAPVFTRGYLGLYARFLGLNEAAVSQAFNKIKSEPAPELRLTAANIESQARPYRRRSYLGSWLLLIPVVAIGGILLYQLFDNNSWLMTQINGAFNAPQASGETTPAEGGSANSGNEIVLEVGGTPLSPEGTPLSPESAQNIPGLTPPPASDSSATNSEQGAETAVSDTPPASTANRGIQLSFSVESWIEIKDSGNKKVLSKLVKAGEKIELPADGAPYNLNLGRPDGVVMLINGQEQPLENYRQKNSGRRFNVDVPNG